MLQGLIIVTTAAHIHASHTSTRVGRRDLTGSLQMHPRGELEPLGAITVAGLPRG